MGIVLHLALAFLITRLQCLYTYIYLVIEILVMDVMSLIGVMSLLGVLPQPPL